LLTRLSSRAEGRRLVGGPGLARRFVGDAVLQQALAVGGEGLLGVRVRARGAAAGMAGGQGDGADDDEDADAPPPERIPPERVVVHAWRSMSSWALGRRGGRRNSPRKV